MTTYTRHPASAQWRDHTDDEFSALKASIRRNGCTEPIVHTPDSRIFDGWHRHLACAAVGVDARYAERDLTDERIAHWVIDHHKGRRHLPAGELATSAVRTLRACGIEFADTRGGRPRVPDPDADMFPETITRNTIASQTGVSEPTAQRAIAKVKREETGDPADTPDKRPQTAPDGSGGRDAPAAGPDSHDAQGASGREDDADPAKTDGVTLDAIGEIEKDLEYLRAENEDLTHRLAIAERAADGSNREAIHRANRLQRLNETLKSQVAQWQTRTNEARGTIRGLRKRVIELERRVQELEDGL